MIGINIIGKGLLDLQSTTAVTFELISPLFKDSVAETGYSYPLEIALTEKNKKLLGFLDRLDIAQDFTPYPCVFSLDGIQLFEATLNITNVNPHTKKAQAFLLSYEFDTEELDTPLRNIPLGGIRSIVPGLYASMHLHANDLLTATSDTNDYCFAPTYNALFYDDRDINSGVVAPHTYSKVINLWDFHAQSYFFPVDENQILQDNVGAHYVLDTAPLFVEYPPKQSTFVPYFFVVSVLKYIAEYLGDYSLTGEWVADDAIKKLCIYNTFSLDSISSLTFTPFGPIPFYKSDADIDPKNHIPDVTITEFLNGIAAMFNLSVIISPKEKSLKIDSKTNRLIDGYEVEYDYSPNFSITKPNAISEGIQYELLTDENDLHQDNFKHIVITDNQILSDSDTFQSEDAPTAIRFSPTVYRGIAKNTGKTNIIPSGPAYRIGKGKKEKKIPVGCVDTARNINIDYAGYDNSSPTSPITYLSGIILYAKQIGNSELYEVNQDYIFRLMFYAGMYTHPEGYGDYPIATNNIYDDNGNQILPYSLKWRGGEHSLYEAWHQGWEEILFAKEVQVLFRLSVTEFLNLDFTKKVRIGNRLFFIKKIQVPITQNGISTCTATCVMLPL